MLRNLLWSIALLASSTLAQKSSQTAIITITASHGGAGNGLTNSTVTVPLNKPFTDSTHLSAVSYLYLTGGTGVPFSSITCQAYQDSEATESAGDPFNSTSPALLSTNTVQVGSVLCTTSYIALAPPGGNFSTSILATSTGNLSTTSRTSVRPHTSVYVTTITPTGGEPATQSTVTSVFVPSEPSAPASPTEGSGAGAGGAEQNGSATSSAGPGLSSANAGPGMGREREFGAAVYGGLAVAWMGVAYAL